MFNLLNRKPIIEFVSIDPAYSYIPKPDNSRKFLPTWIKRMKEMTSEGQDSRNRKLDTVRKCVPFLDAMKAGYMIPAPCDIWIKVYKENNTYTKEVRSSINLGGEVAEVISEHAIPQMSPDSPYRGLILKFINAWKINTRPGYSCLFINPINHGNKYFESFAGVVDTDSYHNIINFPFRILNPNNEETFEFMIKRGEPIIQVIPFKRSEAYAKCNVRGAKDFNEWKHELKDKDYVAGNFSWYREHTVEKKITLEK